MIALDLGNRPYPEYWRAGLALYWRVRDTVHDHVLTWGREVRRAAWLQLAVLESLVRRLLHLMAMGLILPPLKRLAPKPFGVEMTGAGSGSGGGPGCRFRLHEGVGHGSGGAPPEHPASPDIIALIDNGLLMERLARLRAVFANPDPVVLRLARHLRRGEPMPLRDVPVAFRILRRLPPVFDTLLMSLDALRVGEPWDGPGRDTS